MYERDHPRICGEHVGHGAHEGDCEGSSPHMRGTLASITDGTVSFGIIPAYAGNTPCRRRIRVRWWDHPRICGEHKAKTASANVNKGSSPHMRGTHTLWLECCRLLGIIPAYAGNTSHRRRIGCIPRDHPRICGEHGVVAVSGAVHLGSSPHMRGTPDQRADEQTNRGIIPAYAGNTMTRDSCPPIWLGSSPHMRGTLSLVHAAEQFDGIIPAYAGNTV